MAAQKGNLGLNRWLLAYSWFYHSGVASQLAVRKDSEFYLLANLLASGTNAPRGAERRHFRGEAARESIQWFSEQYPQPEKAFDSLTDSKTFRGVIEKTRRWPQFGPWIGFKVADMLERVVGVPIDFSDCDLLGFYRAPRLGAFALAQKRGFSTSLQALGGLVEQLIREFSDFDAPPRFDRSVGIQEVETCLCKWHSHVHGHYPVGKDTAEVRHSLAGFGPLAERLLKFVPDGSESQERHRAVSVKREDLCVKPPFPSPREPQQKSLAFWPEISDNMAD